MTGEVILQFLCSLERSRPGTAYTLSQPHSLQHAFCWVTRKLAAPWEGLTAGDFSEEDFLAVLSNDGFHPHVRAL